MDIWTIARTLKIFILISSLSFLLAPVARAQEWLKLSSEIYTAVDELKESLEDMEKMQDALNDIKEHKTPTIAANEWSNLAEEYEKAAKEMRNAPLPVSFDSKPYAISLKDLQNCSLKDVNLKKLNDYLSELVRASQRGFEALTVLDNTKADVKISREMLAYCIDVHEQLGKAPIFGIKFQWDWVELNVHVSKALGEFETAISEQRKKIIEERKKIDLCRDNLAANRETLDIYLSEHCQVKPPRQPEIVNVQNSSPASDERTSKGFYIFLTTDISDDGKTFTLISRPLLYEKALSDPMSAEKTDFIRSIRLQMNSRSESFRTKIAALEIESVSVHYAKPYSRSLLRSPKEGFDAINAYKQMMQNLTAGLSSASQQEFTQLQ